MFNQIDTRCAETVTLSDEIIVNEIDVSAMEDLLDAQGLVEFHAFLAKHSIH